MIIFEELICEKTRESEIEKGGHWDTHKIVRFF
jgi:hypothetical protein